MKPMFNALLSLASVAAAAAALLSGPAHAQEEEKVLNVYNWSDYIADDTLKNFEKETGIKVRYDNFDNNEIVHAKLVAGKTGYDVVVPSSGWAKLQADGGLLRKIDKSLLPNYKNLDPDIQAQLAKLDPGNQYMVNWLWGYDTVGINVDKVKAALGGLPMPDNAWDLIFKPEYISKMKSCGVSFLDSATEVVRGRALVPRQERLQQEPRRLCRRGLVAQIDSPLRDAVFSFGLHQRHGQRLDLPGLRLVG
jgi:putrescine transport system substrate-binding protein